ncbi:TraB family [Providencia rustigianii]|uniref:GumN protein n=1 Tax=Providencia rustigianii DSM 4541 TaxID=500637 RepID=D1P4E3_9GAMM|nr:MULTISPECIES: TraB/GumN family protein [Providencia]EFB71769.1 GumN protein [Providencia rustigianii DSM 4541]MTC55489.1 polysaccharide biosynthesis protein GumN [Providencia rustigianii]MTC60114.1 polysaccharide biosynthesis protein GumN [Providencia rustigianii]SUC28099.1 TraB family [Providencia rustigianii]VEB72551.1 TraB family [Providencia rustigianii]
MGTFFKNLKNWLYTGTAPVYPYPAIDVRLSNQLKLHIVGSIHMGTETMFPLSTILLDKLNHADGLIVEADITDTQTSFPAPTTPISPIRQRLTDGEYSLFLQYCQEIRQSSDQFDHLPSWQVALVMQATQAQGLGLRGHYGIDYQLIRNVQSQQKPIIELEGTAAQIELLLQLPDQGLPLLQDTLVHWRTNARSLQTMISWWLDYQPEHCATLPNTFSEDVYNVLMTRRNQEWADKLKTLPNGNYVVAVGALHLFGEHSLIDYLRNDS